MSIPSQLNKSTELFSDIFGTTSTHAAAAPGRVNLIGEHIDYCHGYSLPCAIPHYTIALASKNPTNRIINLHAQGYQPTEINLDYPLTPGEPSWANYIKGVIQGFLDLGVEIPHGLNILITSDIPIGAGLSSSAALEVCIATLLEQITEHTLTKKQKALLCQKAEHSFAGVPCGIMDQFASTFGQPSKLTLIDCLTEQVELIPFPENELSLIITNSMVSHSLADGEYAKRRQQTEQALTLTEKKSWRDVTLTEIKNITDPTLSIRAKHIVTEIQRTLDAAHALKQKNYRLLGDLMTESHISLKNDYQVSCPELDTLVDIANASPHVLGSRMTGGGFGGSTITLCNKQHADLVSTHIKENYISKTKITPQILTITPAKGAHILA